MIRFQTKGKKMNFDLADYPHRRYNPLKDEWILVSPHRMKRPWQGQREAGPPDNRPAYDPKCYLCPGNERAGGATNARYDDTFVFVNDYAALLPDTPLAGTRPDGLLQCEPVQGESRVICFSPRHDLTLPEMEESQIVKVIEVWADQVTDLGSRFRWVQVFENKGAVMGCSNPHPHGQVWAGNFLPRFPEQEERSQHAYLDAHSAPLLTDYLDQELQQDIRIVDATEHWVMLVPYWAVWPFELLLLPRRHVRGAFAG